MKKLLLLSSLSAILFTSCLPGGGGQLVGAQGRIPWFMPDPYGTLYIPMGSYNMGPSDQDVPYAMTTRSKTVSVQAFYMDETEITNNEWRQFEHWVRDSLAHRKLGDAGFEEHLRSVNDYGEDIDPPFINWYEQIRWSEPEEREVLEEMFYPEFERFMRIKELDSRKLDYEYFWIDYKDAAKKGGYEAPLRQRGMTDRSIFIKRDVINVYPDTLCWIYDFTYSYNEPMTKNYYWHPAYDEYPVVGVSWKQARAFNIWRTNLLNSFLYNTGGYFVNDFRLPTESEWEYAARGGLDLSPFPWGGPYIRNSRGCFLANFKPLRGNYVDDGGFHTVNVYSYSPNDYGLYCMAGNVAECTSNAYDESAYEFAHDLNMDYVYEAKDNDPPVLKRKVVRGGSWKDIGYYTQTSTRTYEYQDTSKSYIGFRCVMTYLGRAKGDGL